MSAAEGSVIADLVVGVPAILGALCFLVSAIAMTRVGDALSRINVLSVATGLGMTLFVIATFTHETVRGGFSWVTLLEAVVAIGATLGVTSVASVTLARAAYRSGAELDPRTRYDDLVDDSGDPRDVRFPPRDPAATRDPAED